jgi:hypothetical protein
MKWLLAGMLLLMGACAQLPTIEPMEANRIPAIEMDCRSHFPQGRWQLVHTIRARFYGGRQATFTGVVVLSTHNESIHCVLMTVEGMVLFEAVDDRHSITVKRAFGPFENPDFAQGVMADIRFLFFMPEGGLITAGAINDGTRTCRYQGQGRTIVDLMEPSGGGWAMHQYDAHGKLLRRAVADAVNSQGIASRMGIDAGSGRHAYHLSMDLVESVKLP